MDNLHARVSDAVRTSGLSGSAIARGLGVVRSNVSQKLSGIRSWSLRDVELLYDVLPAGDRLVLVPERETLAYAFEQARGERVA